MELAWFPIFSWALALCESRLCPRSPTADGHRDRTRSRSFYLLVQGLFHKVVPTHKRPFVLCPPPAPITMHLPSHLLCSPSTAPPQSPQLALRVALEKIAMGKDSQAHWRGYFAWGPLYLKLSSKGEMSWFAFSHWSMQSSWGVFLISKYRLLWFALGPSLGLEQLWKHLYAAHLNPSRRQIFSGLSKGRD